MTLLAGFRVIKRTQAVGNFQHSFKCVLIRSVSLLIYKSIGLVIKTGGRFGRLLSKG